jgi:hypothetical protein
MNRRALFAAGLGGAALAVAQAFGAPARALADNAPMLIGRANTALKTTQISVARAIALKCASDSKDALVGEAKGRYAAGVYGVSSNAKGLGVRARNTATKTSVELAGTAGVRAWAPVDGLALDVEGQAHFSRSGRITVPDGYSWAEKDLGPDFAAPRTGVLVTLMTPEAQGNFIRYAYISAGGLLHVEMHTFADRPLEIAYLALD